jgi:hypothetical protein
LSSGYAKRIRLSGLSKTNKGHNVSRVQKTELSKLKIPAAKKSKPLKSHNQMEFEQQESLTQKILNTAKIVDQVFLVLLKLVGIADAICLASLL